MFKEQVITFPFIKGSVIYKKDVLKLVQFVCECFLLGTVLKMLSPSRLNRWNSAAHNFRRFREVGLFAQPPKPRRPTASRRKRLRRHAAPPGGIQRPRGGCRASAVQRGCGGRQEERHWPGASEAGSGARNPVSPTWGTSKSVSGCFGLEILPGNVCILSKCLAKLWLSTSSKHATNLGVNDRNVAMQHFNNLICAWSTFKKCKALMYGIWPCCFRSRQNGKLYLAGSMFVNPKEWPFEWCSGGPEERDAGDGH